MVCCYTVYVGKKTFEKPLQISKMACLFFASKLHCYLAMDGNGPSF